VTPTADTGSVTCVTESGHHAAVHRLHGGKTAAWIVRAVHPVTQEVRYFGPFPDVPTTRQWVNRHLGAVVVTTDPKVVG
jgi:hypothetical protein